MGPDGFRRAGPKPHSLAQISFRSWRYLLGRTVREFVRDECLDLAAGLTYYAVLAVFPGLIALISTLGLLGRGPESVATILEVARRLMPAEALTIVSDLLQSLAQSRPTLGLVLGLLGALWFVSGYVAAFGRAMNRIYAIREGRPIWKLQPLMIGITLVLGLLSVFAVLLLLISGPIAQALGEVLHLGRTVVAAWNTAKWPVLVAVVFVVIALLYDVTPNVRQPRFRWLSPGSVLAVLTWVVGSLLFGLYVSNFSNYDATYGSLAGIVVFLVWLFVSNLALLLGAELNAELERARELQSGIPAEQEVQLPLRDTRATEKDEAQREKDFAAARELRRSHRRR